MTDLVQVARSALPALAGIAHLNTGGAGPMPDVAIDAIRDAVAIDATTPRMSEAAVSRMEARRSALRQSIASLVGAGPADIALTTGVTAAINTVVWGIDWQPGDEVITTNAEHAGLTAPLQAVAERHGVVVRTIDVVAPTVTLGEAVDRLAGPRTRLVAISHVTWTTGATLDVAAAARVARTVGALTLVDGAQAVGVVPTDVPALGVDAYAVNAPKWLLGPQGLGALWIAAEARARIHVGTSGRGSGDDTAGGTVRWHDDARRYELGQLAEPMLPGWTAALEWLSALGADGGPRGVDWIAERTAAAVAAARRVLAEHGAHVLTPEDSVGGLLAFTVPGVDPVAATSALEARGVVLRWVPAPPAFRASVGFFTDTTDLSRLADGLAAIRG